MTTGGGRYVGQVAVLALCGALALAAQGCGCGVSTNDGTTRGSLASGLKRPQLIAA